MLSRKQKLVGLDIGDTSVKAVVMRRSRTGVELLGAHRLDLEEEGILSETELRDHLFGWLAQIGCAREEIFMGLPQFLGTLRLTDFPQTAGDSLEAMVGYETRQVAGLSEEDFLHDFVVLHPAWQYQNPVLIGICRASLVQERAESLAAAKLNIAGFGMNGVAMVNAALALEPELAQCDAPQLLLDIGSENTTVGIIAAGILLAMNTISEGSQELSQELLSAHLPGVFAGELQDTLAHWKEQDETGVSGQAFEQILICGGGAGIDGLQTYLGNLLGSPVRELNCRSVANGPPEPAYVTAFGLALQGLKQCALPLEFTPESTTWQARRRQNFPKLVAALTVFTLVIMLTFLKATWTLDRETQELEAQLSVIGACESLLPRLDKTTATIKQNEDIMRPFVAKGNRSRVLLEVVGALAQARNGDKWFLYLGDEASYRSAFNWDNTQIEPEKKKTKSSSALFMGMMGNGPAKADEPGNPTSSLYPNIQPVSKVDIWQNFIVGGCTQMNAAVPYYKPLREIVETLNRNPLFKDVDILPEALRAPEKDIFRPWVELLKRPEYSSRNYRAFILQLPLARKDILDPQPGHQGGRK
jgi:Tfp pilus assembly PilM family ATPase